MSDSPVPARKTLPDEGRPWDDIEREMDALVAAHDLNWRAGRLSMFVFSVSDEVAEVQKKAFNKFFTENALGAARAFGSIDRMQKDIVAMGLSLLNAPPGADGNVTTGGSESIFLALKACRDWARVHRPEVRQPNIVLPVSAHLAFEKACHVMDIAIRRTPLRADFGADPAAMAAAIDDQTLLIAGSAPCFPHGIIDPITEIAAVAERHGVWMHVDACVGGYFAPFARLLNYPVPAFDFAAGQVWSISADLHKFGYTAKPASTVFYRDAELMKYQIFDFDSWTSMRMITPGVTGTRPGGAVAAAWAVLNHLGMDGYKRVCERLMNQTRRFIAGVRAIDGMTVYGEPHLSLVNFGPTDVDAYAVADEMSSRGWLIGRTKEPRALHIMMSLIHEQAIDQYLEDLARAVTAVRAKGTGYTGSTQARYA